MNTKTNCAMNANHTPGKWTISIETDVYAPGPDGKVLVAECDCSNFIPYAQKIANAALIALAPTLLAQRDALRAALQALLNASASLDQSATRDGLKNCDALAQARAALNNSKD